MHSIITRSNCPCCGGINIEKAIACKDYTVSNEIFDIWECGDCSLRFTQHIPTEDSIAPYYKSDTYISHSDTEKGFVNKIYKIARNYTLNWKIRLVKQSLGNKVKEISLLDIGSGTGAFLRKAFTAGFLVTGLEPDDGARKICKDKYDLQLEEPQNLFELTSEKYDVVTMWHVLEHVHELHQYMDQIKRVLKKDGVLLIALPNYTSLDARQYGVYWAAYDVPRHLYHFTLTALSKLAAQHGMRVQSIKSMWLDAFYIAMLSEEYKKGKSNLVAALVNGVRSNLHALKNKAACSSLVYIIRHNDAINQL
jgi:2-polyprenyl-3-methyl-5-hydroxy-6-metoxy-1,4-benzoquinol methylase